ncbi:MAG: SPOR domain-containing protein [Aquamicrobium sp.]|uniref:SPOR domain-containing protein n=1 Tax=Aquamicrobium sp. TaxID=1872579 RepID=UPI00349EA4F5|nr:SPOR domain-containing protein [Aquamicrobium sp.]
MADTNNVRRDDYVDFSENDPFAELTRIMGHDPRAPEPQAAAPAAPLPTPAMDDFEIDLEKELAGDFDFSDFDEQAPVADWREESPAAAYPHDGADAGEEVSAASLDADFEDFFAEPAAGEAAPAATYAAPEATYQAPEAPEAYDAPAAFEDGLDDALERELLGGEDYEAYEAEPVPEPEWTGREAYDEAPREEPVRHEAAAYDDVADDGWTADAEFDVDMLERELAASAAQDAVSAPEAAAPAYVAPADFAPQPDPVEAEADFAFDDAPETPAEPQAAHSLSLEEELSLLLSDDPAPTPAPASPSTVNVAAAAATAAVASAAVYPASSAFGSYGRANFPPAHSPAVAMTPAVARHQETPVEATSTFEQPAYEAYAPRTAPDVAEEQAPQAQAEDEFSGLFDDDFEFTLEDEPKAAAPAAAPRAALPEIETVEVAETVQPVADDLDIPDIDYGAQDASAAAPFDDLEAEFADVFGTVAQDAPPPAAAPVVAAAPDMQPYMLDDAQWQAAQSFPGSDVDYESDLEKAIASSAYDEDEAQPAPRRRFILVAAAIAGVALLGGFGVFGMSMFGGGSDAPALVRADSEPMKVRPENPGGTTVPNQNNEVYQRVAGGTNNAAPEQERLISSTEEPVDVNAREAAQEPAVLAPGIDDEAGAVKSEDRIEPEAAQPAVAEETAVVTPRRVRTMVVRPDGTMVPREEIEPTAAEPAPGQPADIAGQPAAQPLAGVLAQPADGALTAEIDDGPVVDTPQTVAVVPTQRAEPQAPAPARPAAQAPVQQPAAQPAVQQPAAPAPVAAPVSAPAAAAPAGATSEWSMQIASQPTAEGAQSTYQDLARRYGGVLEGKGVNIVRADIEGRGTYYRVRIPASSRDEAIQLCTRYKAAGGSCFVSR